MYMCTVCACVCACMNTQTRAHTYIHIVEYAHAVNLHASDDHCLDNIAEYSLSTLCRSLARSLHLSRSRARARALSPSLFRARARSHKPQAVHGSDDQSLDNIAEYGFNRSYAGKNACSYGSSKCLSGSVN
jgi:hypothetical protein